MDEDPSGPDVQSTVRVSRTLSHTLPWGTRPGQACNSSLWRHFSGQHRPSLTALDIGHWESSPCLCAVL